MVIPTRSLYQAYLSARMRAVAEAQRRYVVLHHVLPGAASPEETADAETRRGGEAGKPASPSHRVTASDHWDLMLEMGDVLATWQLTCPPEKLNTAGAQAEVRRISDHRKLYLD